MAMYYRGTVRKGGKRRLIAVTVLVVLILLVDAVSGGTVRSEVRYAAAAVSRWTASVNQAVWGSGIFTSRSSLEAQNRTLTAQLSYLSERAGQADLLQKENAGLRALVHLAENSPGITAPVMSSLLSSPYGTFLIGLGNGENVSRGDLVLTEGGFVVGLINETNAGTALVSEVLAPGASIEALLDGASVFVEGEGGGNGRTEAPRGLKVSIGDVVVVPEFGQRGVGIVGAVASSSASASQHVYIRLPNTLSSMQFVYVIHGND